MVNKHDLCELDCNEEDYSSTKAMVKAIGRYNKQKDQEQKDKLQSSEGTATDSQERLRMKCLCAKKTFLL